MSYKRKRITVKIGSNVLARPDGTLDITRMSALTDQIAELHKAGVEIIVISSGAVASGRSELKIHRKLDAVSARQLFSAVGQAKLINRYYELFREHNIACGQVLTTKENFSTRRQYLTQKQCMEVMLENKVIPIVNENDTISVTELMFTDNDELSGLISAMMDSETLVILSNIDGIYNVAPGATLQIEPGARLHFHHRASLLVQGKLQVEGSMEAPVQIRGDRLDRLFADLPYDNLGGQWGGIRFYPESFGNKISYAYVRGMTSGIVLDSCASEEPRLEIANSRIRNSSGNLITSAYSRLNCWNSELSDAGGAILSLTGGIADFTHCTIVNYYFYDIITSPIVNMSYCAPADTISGGPALLRARFNNSILYGNTSEIPSIDLTGSHVYFRSCLLRSNGEDDDNFINTIWNGQPFFKATGEEHYYYDYRIGSDKSDAIGKGNPDFAIFPLDKDMYGNLRSTSVDIGAYQYIPQEIPEE